MLLQRDTLLSFEMSKTVVSGLEANIKLQLKPKNMHEGTVRGESVKQLLLFSSEQYHFTFIFILWFKE